jgi:SAM-dependent methyltransferase
MMDAAVGVEEFVLSQDVGDIVIENDLNVIGEWRWMPLMQRETQYLALNIVAGEAVLSPVMKFGHDLFWRCHLTQSLETLSDDGLVAELFFRAAGGDERVLFEIPMLPGRQNEVVATFELRQLEGLHGRLGIRCKPGPLGNPLSDWLAILRWIVGREDRLGLLNGRANRSWRIKNEISAFDTVYDHPMYAHRDAAGDDGAGELLRAAEDVAPDRAARTPPDPELSADDIADLSVARVRPGEDVFNYSNRLMTALAAEHAEIDFAARLRQLARAGRPLRFLTLCSGAAGVERNLIAAARVPVEITLYDINEKLTKQAAAALSRFGPLQTIVGDVNAISADQFDGQFDVITCVSGLHHLVELEHVVRTVLELLAQDGEFWMIGEQIGRDGNRLWPEAFEVANRHFSALPESFRRNARTGEIDASIPDTDFAASTFEGIRSSEIERVMQGFFEPVQLNRRNCFLWRVFENAYFANYDLTDDAHRRIVLEIVAAEYNLWKRGGRPTECFGIYRPRRRDAVRRLLNDAPA